MTEKIEAGEINTVPAGGQRSAWLGKYSPFALLRTLYDWVVALADKPYATPALFLLALAEASFFPVPPDVLLIALAVAIPSRSLWYALVCSLGSMIGAAVGYLIGFHFFELLGRPIVDFYQAQELYVRTSQLYDEWNAVAVAVAGFSPIPFKVFTIAAGALKINFLIFMAASAVSRSARFFLVAGLIWWFGPAIRQAIDRYFNLLVMLFLALFAAGFLMLKYVF